MGCPEFALPTLEVLYQKFTQQLIGVITKPPAPKGRNKIMDQNPIHGYAISVQLPVYMPLQKEEIASIVKKLDPSLIIIIAYGMLIPNEITEKYLCINIHASLLPKYRGASPIHACLLNREKETGITLIKINSKLDAGPILYQARIPILPQDDFGSLYNKLAELSANSLMHYFQKYAAVNHLPQIQQEESKATYCKKIEKEEYKVTTTMDPQDFLARVKAFSPIPGAYLLYEKKRYKILKAKLNQENQIEILEIQPEGKKTMSYNEFLLGNKKIL